MAIKGSMIVGVGALGGVLLLVYWYKHAGSSQTTATPISNIGGYYGFGGVNQIDTQPNTVTTPAAQTPVIETNQPPPVPTLNKDAIAPVIETNVPPGWATHGVLYGGSSIGKPIGALN